MYYSPQAQPVHNVIVRSTDPVGSTQWVTQIVFEGGGYIYADKADSDALLFSLAKSLFERGIVSMDTAEFLNRWSQRTLQDHEEANWEAIVANGEVPF